jgi:hypothetical protein
MHIAKPIMRQILVEIVVMQVVVNVIMDVVVIGDGSVVIEPLLVPSFVVVMSSLLIPLEVRQPAVAIHVVKQMPTRPVYLIIVNTVILLVFVVVVVLVGLKVPEQGRGTAGYRVSLPGRSLRVLENIVYLLGTRGPNIVL